MFQEIASVKKEMLQLICGKPELHFYSDSVLHTHPLPSQWCIKQQKIAGSLSSSWSLKCINLIQQLTRFYFLILHQASISTMKVTRAKNIICWLHAFLHVDINSLSFYTSHTFHKVESFCRTKINTNEYLVKCFPLKVI